MSKVEFKIDTINEFKTNINNSYNNLIEIIKEMETNSSIFKESGHSKTLDLFNEFMENILKKLYLVMRNYVLKQKKV